MGRESRKSDGKPQLDLEPDYTSWADFLSSKNETFAMAFTQPLTTFFWTSISMILQVIHLVRDPRGILASMLHRESSLSTQINKFKDYCDLMLDDLKMSKSMPRSR